MLLYIEIFCNIQIQLFMYHCLCIKDIDKNYRFNFLLLICLLFFFLFSTLMLKEKLRPFFMNIIIIKLLMTKVFTHHVTLWTFALCKKVCHLS